MRFCLRRQPRENVQLACDAGVPVIQVERPTDLPTCRVLVDNYVGGVAAMEHLLALGHRRIAFIGSPAQSDPSAGSGYVEQQRYAAYADTLGRYAIEVDPRLVTFGRYYTLEGRGTPGDGYRYTHQFLSEEPRPTAIFATCDFLAAGVYQALYECQLRVPDDISVVGFDDTLGLYLTPPLSTIALPILRNWSRSLPVGD